MSSAKIIKIEWSEIRKPDDKIRYDHVIGTTPIGPVHITWKSYKEYIVYYVDEAPWYLKDGFEDIHGNTVEDAKEKSQLMFERFVSSCLC